MIDNKILATTIENALNDLIQEDKESVEPHYPCLHTVDIFSGKVTNYRFKIFTDSGEFKKGEREGNTVTRYINGEFVCTGGTSETTQNGQVNSSLSAYITFSVQLNEDNGEFCDCVKRLLTDYFSKNAYGSMSDNLGITFAYGVSYAIPSTGSREVAVMQGDYVTITVNLQYFFIECGLNSGAVQLMIDGEIVPYTLFGISRKSDQEPGINSSKDADGGKLDSVSGFMTTSTIYTINFTMPVILSGVCPILDGYIFDGDTTAHLVTIKRPFYNGTKYKEGERNYIMVFSDSANNMEDRKNASASFTMTIALESDTQEYSAAAQDYIDQGTSEVK